MHVSEKKFYVKIDAGPQAGGNPCVYHNKDFPLYIKAITKIERTQKELDNLIAEFDKINLCSNITNSIFVKD